jgi:transcriptional regulator with XRE-family HTH domain
MAQFTPERRERLLTLLETGRTLEESAADVGISTVTVRKWANGGRNGKSEPEIEFARRLDAIREGEGEQRLAEADVVRLAEQAARKGSVTAMKILLDRFKADAAPVSKPDEFDELKARRRAG